MLELGVLPFTAEARKDLSTSGRGSSPSTPHHPSPDLPPVAVKLFMMLFGQGTHGVVSPTDNLAAPSATRGLSLAKEGFWSGAGLSGAGRTSHREHCRTNAIVCGATWGCLTERGRGREREAPLGTLPGAGGAGLPAGHRSLLPSPGTAPRAPGTRAREGN